MQHVNNIPKSNFSTTFQNYIHEAPGSNLASAINSLGGLRQGPCLSFGPLICYMGQQHQLTAKFGGD